MARPASGKFQVRLTPEDWAALERLTSLWTPAGGLPSRADTLRRAVRECLAWLEENRHDKNQGDT